MIIYEIEANFEDLDKYDGYFSTTTRDEDAAFDILNDMIIEGCNDACIIKHLVYGGMEGGIEIVKQYMKPQLPKFNISSLH